MSLWHPHNDIPLGSWKQEANGNKEHVRHGMRMLPKRWICRGEMQRDILPPPTPAREEQGNRQLESRRGKIHVEITISTLEALPLPWCPQLHTCIRMQAPRRALSPVQSQPQFPQAGMGVVHIPGRRWGYPRMGMEMRREAAPAPRKPIHHAPTHSVFSGVMSTL